MTKPTPEQREAAKKFMESLEFINGGINLFFGRIELAQFLAARDAEVAERAVKPWLKRIGEMNPYGDSKNCVMKREVEALLSTPAVAVDSEEKP